MPSFFLPWSLRRRRLVGLLLCCTVSAMAQAPTAEAPPAKVLSVAPRAVAADGAAADDGHAMLQFIGTATVLLRHAGLTLLTDPNFLHRGEHVHLGYGLKSKRLTEPAISFDRLPPLDVVLLSHFHGDHFDQRVQRRLDKDLPIVTTQGAVKHLDKLGFRHVVGLATWQSVELRRGEQRWRITALPGRHGPPVMNRALPEVMGSLIESLDAQGRSRLKLYVSGDTLVHDDLREIPRRFPGLDIALLHLGGTRVLGVLVTMDAEQGVQAMQMLDPREVLPIHYDDYEVFKSPLSDFLAAASKAGLRDKVRVLPRGQTWRFAVPAEGR
jgi:L-ascorbate metabolism protein UlaG (beta-lactamase superfamily)